MCGDESDRVDRTDLDAFAAPGATVVEHDQGSGQRTDRVDRARQQAGAAALAGTDADGGRHPRHPDSHS
jgi:hypothetical protein